MNIHKTLARLAKKRPVFHSEADFQFALAWAIQQEHKQAKIRLEWPTPNPAKAPAKRDAKDIHVDIMVEIDKKITAVELKYKTRKWVETLGGEGFNLKEHHARNLSRYDFMRDVRRVERLVEVGAADRGIAILLTNQQGYWTGPHGGTKDRDFSLRADEGKTIEGELKWRDHPSASGIKGREMPIKLCGSYPLCWRGYSQLAGPPNASAFRYLAVEVE